MKYRPLTADDYDIWRSIRLEALLGHPDSYLTTYDDELTRPRSQSVNWLASGKLMAAFDGDELCAVMSVGPEGPATMAHRGWVHAVYCRPNWRGVASRRLIDYAVSKARAKGLLQLELYVGSTNARAIGFYERFGIRMCGRIPCTVRIEGQFQDDLHYWLPLDHDPDTRG